MKKKSKKQDSDYEYLDEDTIRSVCNGDSRGMESVVAKYKNYVNNCLWKLADKEFALNPIEIPLEDITQTVWMKYFQTLLRKFKDSR